MRPSVRIAVVGLLCAAGANPARADLVVASWNIQTLATNGVVFKGDHERSEEDFALLRAARDELGADVVVLQEVTSPHAVSKVFPPSDYVICFSGQYDADAAGLAPTYPRSELAGIRPTCFDRPGAALPDPPKGETRRQYVAIVVRRGSGVAVESIEDVPDLGLTVEEENRGTRETELRNLRWGLEAVLRTDAGRLRLLGVHLKSGCPLGGLWARWWNDPSWTWTPDGRSDHACMTLARQMAPLRAWIAGATASGIPFMIAGDFNRRMDVEAARPGEPDLWPIITGAETADPTDDVALARVPEGETSVKACWPEDDGTELANAIDYLIFGPGVRPDDWPSSYRKLRYADLVDPATGARLTKDKDAKRTSDHCPISVTLR